MNYFTLTRVSRSTIPIHANEWYANDLIQQMDRKIHTQ